MTPAQAIQRIKPGDRIKAACIGVRHSHRCDVGSMTGPAIIVAAIGPHPHVVIDIDAARGMVFRVDAENILSASRIRFRRGSIYA